MDKRVSKATKHLNDLYNLCHVKELRGKTLAVVIENALEGLTYDEVILRAYAKWVRTHG